MNPLLIRRRGMMGAQQGGLPYDAQIEYLESTGTQYINTHIECSSLNFIVECECWDKMPLFGWMHDNAGNGTWIFAENVSAWYKNYNARIKLNSTPSGKSIYKYDSSSGIYINGTLNGSFTVSIGTDSINGHPMWFLNVYDFYTNGLPSSVKACKIGYFKITLNNTLVRDYIPVRVGTVGYMYDRVSGQLFGNAGTGDFILGPDIQ